MDIKYRLESIVETEFRINYDFGYESFDTEKIIFQIGHSVRPDIEKGTITIDACATLAYDEQEVFLSSNAIRMVFGVNPIREVIELKEDGTFASPVPTIIDNFQAAAIGVLRGIYTKNLKGTPLENCYLPLVPIERRNF